MRKVVLYIAMSIDGYIADADGRVDWLEGDGSQPENRGTYDDFYGGVDCVIMGSKTYDQIVNELSPGLWPYKGRQCYVVSSRKILSAEDVSFTSEPLDELIGRLKLDKGRDIWICGGATIAQQLIDLDLIDRYHISVIPTILGSGKALFGERSKQLPLELVATHTYNGITDLVYERRKI